MPTFSEWAPYALGFLVLLAVSIGIQVDRLGKAHDKLVNLLLHIKEVRDGVHEAARSEREDEAL